MLVNAFVWEVDNGGMNQVICNSSGNHAEELRLHLRAIGANDAAEALDEVSRRIYGGGPIPAEETERRNRLFAWEALDESAAEDFFDSLVSEANLSSRPQPRTSARTARCSSKRLKRTSIRPSESGFTFGRWMSAPVYTAVGSRKS